MSRKVLYVDTSAVLRATLESGTSPEIEARIGSAAVLITSRLSLVESSRVFLRAPKQLKVRATQLAQAERDAALIWGRCNIFELTEAVCELAGRVAPQKALRSLDALHVATFVLARQRLGELELLSCDDRLNEAIDA